MRRKHTQTAAEKSPSARRLPCRRIREATRGACVRKSVLLTTYFAGKVPCTSYTRGRTGAGWLLSHNVYKNDLCTLQ